MSDTRPEKPVPVVLAMVLCDAIHQDPATHKCTLLGTFSTINVIKFPAVHRQLAVHIALTDGYGKTRIKLMLAHADEKREPLFSREGMIEFADPRVVAELNFTLNNLTFHEPGDYRLQVYGDDLLLSERRVHVLHVAPPKPPSA